MVDPDATQLALITTLNEAYDWCGVLVAGGNMREAFSNSLGKPLLMREVVLISTADYDEAIASCVWTPADPAPPAERGLNAAEKARCRSLRRVCRLRCGLPADDVPSIPPAGAAGGVAPLPPVGASTALAIIGTARKIKLSAVVDQALDAEITPLSSVEVRTLYDVYKSRHGDYPVEDAEATADQISGVSQLVKQDFNPYVDFGVFGPFALRLLRKLTFVAYTVGLGGEYVKKELPGPPDFDTWWKSWRVLKTVFLLIGAVTAERLDAYGEHVRKMAIRFGAICWWLVYQADVKMRLEQFERLRRIAEALHSAATVAGTHSDFNPAKPWDTVFCMAVQSREFWSEHVHEPALLFLSHVKSRGSLEEDMGTAPIHTVEQESTPGRGSKRPRSSAWDNVRDFSPVKTSFEDRSSQSNGKFTHNRKGGQICFAFNDGQCTRDKCPKGYHHQCSVCLSNAHGAHECSNTRPVRQAGEKGKKGKGKGNSSKGKGSRKR